MSVADQNSAALGGASVSLTWTQPGGARAQTATSSGSGVATFNLNNQRVHGTCTP